MAYHGFSREMTAVAMRAAKKILAKAVFPDFAFHPCGPFKEQPKSVFGFIEYTGKNGAKKRIAACRMPFHPGGAVSTSIMLSLGLELGLPLAPSVYDKDQNGIWQYSLMPFSETVEGDVYLDPAALIDNYHYRHSPYYEKWRDIASSVHAQPTPDLEWQFFNDNIKAFSAETPFYEWLGGPNDVGPHNTALDLKAVRKASKKRTALPYYRFDIDVGFGAADPDYGYAFEDILSMWPSIHGYFDEHFPDAELTPDGQDKWPVINEEIRRIFLPFVHRDSVRDVTKRIQSFSNEYLHAMAKQVVTLLSDLLPDEKGSTHQATVDDYLGYAHQIAETLISRRDQLEKSMEVYMRRAAPPSPGNPFLAFRAFVERLKTTAHPPEKIPGRNTPPHSAGL